MIDQLPSIAQVAAPLPPARPRPQGPNSLTQAPAGPPDRYTPLQKHVAFFDKDADGKLTLAETTQGLGELGVAKLLQTATALFINGGLGFRTNPSHRPTLTVDIANIKAGKHPGDTGIFDKEGNFNPARFDELFAKYDADRSGSLSWQELEAMITDNARRDGAGKPGAIAEFKLLMRLAANGKTVENGKEVPTISRERLLQFYNGTLFYRIAAERRAAGL